jgi:hypothetical protein
MLGHGAVRSEQHRNAVCCTSIRGLRQNDECKTFAARGNGVNGASCSFVRFVCAVV